MKPMVKALVACGLLAALIGVFFLSKNWKSEGEQTAEPTPDDRIQLTADTPVTQAVLRNDRGEITLAMDEEGEWTIVEHDYARLVTSTISSIAGMLKGFMSTETVTETANASLAEFGLDPPAGVVTVTHEDGLRESLFIGARSPFANSYYAMKEGGDVVVLISGYNADRLLYGYEDFRDRTLPTLDAAALEEVRLKTEQEEIWLVGGIEKPEGSFSFSSLTMMEPYPGRDVAGDRLQTDVLEVTPNLAINGFVEDNVTDLTVYGLDKPVLELRIRDAENTLDLRFGGDAPDGNVYVMMADEPHVYTMEKSLMQPLLSVTGFNLADRFIIIFGIATVDTLHIRDGDRLWTLSIQRTPQEGEEEPLETYFLDGVQQEEKLFKSLYETTISIMGDAPWEEEQARQNGFSKGAADVTVTFHFNNGNEPVEMNLYRVDENFYAAERNGVMQFLTSRRYMDTLRQKLKEVSEA